MRTCFLGVPQKIKKIRRVSATVAKELKISLNLQIEGPWQKNIKFERGAKRFSFAPGLSVVTESYATSAKRSAM
jgi:hypothetical protein